MAYQSPCGGANALIFSYDWQSIVLEVVYCYAACRVAEQMLLQQEHYRYYTM